VGLTPLLWWSSRRSWVPALAGLILVNAVIVSPSYGHTVWSPYQKLVGHFVATGPNQEADAYLVEISDVFYQAAVDRRPEKIRRDRHDPSPHYDAFYRHIPTPERVLVVGAGMGNDVASALRAGAEQVDAVDIDPAIVEMGRKNHPERPYGDERVRVIVDDARQFLRKQDEDIYDVVVFGLLDSHTQLGISSVRLDNYVFTMESFAAAERLVKPGGFIVVSAATFDYWFRDRLEAMLQRTVSSPVIVLDHGLWKSYIGVVGNRAGAAEEEDGSIEVPTDDWPFLYLPQRAIPPAYLWVLACLVVASVVALRLSGVPLGSFSPRHLHFFFLGAAFLLMEVHAINRLALLFGTVWLVSGVTIAIVLLLIVAANFTVMRFPKLPYALTYSGLAVSLGVSYWIQPNMFVGLGTLAELAVSVILLSPVYFAGLVFARSFKVTRVAAAAMGANILGSVLGGWVEYGTTVVGIRGLVLVAAGFYGLSWVMLVLARRRGSEGGDR
jgi:SAM-dependent methyltransferase